MFCSAVVQQVVRDVSKKHTRVFKLFPPVASEMSPREELHRHQHLGAIWCFRLGESTGAAAGAAAGERWSGLSCENASGESSQQTTSVKVGTAGIAESGLNTCWRGFPVSHKCLIFSIQKFKRY